MIYPTLFRSKAKVRILYKSGNEHTFWCYDFTATGDTIAWNSCSQSNCPIQIGVDDIEAAWVVSNRMNVFTFIKQIVKAALK